MAKTSQVEKTTNPSTMFVTMALDMSWRLAIVVLVPIVGGFYLDTALNTSPLMVIVGFLIAMSGMALVMWYTLQKANQATAGIPAKQSKEKEKVHAKQSV